MKLLKSDKEYLKKNGYLDTDISQIERAISVMKYTLEDNKNVSRKYVLENMDRKNWLSGIGRASFHRTSVRETYNGYSVLFDASNFFAK